MYQISQYTHKILESTLTHENKNNIIIFAVRETRQTKYYVRLAQLDRAFGYGPKGRGFESSSARWFLRSGVLDLQALPVFLC